MNLYLGKSIMDEGRYNRHEPNMYRYDHKLRKNEWRVNNNAWSLKLSPISNLGGGLECSKVTAQNSPDILTA